MPGGYSVALGKLDSLSAFGIKPGLERIRALLAALRHPERGFKVVHVAGTNGKGSVCRMIESVLIEAGYGTGMFISPHLVDFRERFRIKGRMAEKADVAACFAPLWKALKSPEVLRHGQPTYFEAVTALAFLIFKRRGCKVLVLETGLGGRYDSTNVIARPLLTLVTNISLEHTQILGKTEEKIAWEKAGILKKGSPAVTGARGRALKVIRRVAGQVKASAFRAVNAGGWSGEEQLWPGVGQWVHTPRGTHYIPLLGPHQRENLACALEGLDLLRGAGLKIGAGAMERGLAKADWPGRMQVLRRDPLLLLDGAHNAAGAQALARSLKALGLRKAQIVFGVLRDKNWKGMLRALKPVAGAFHFIRPDDARGLGPEEIRSWGGVKGKSYPDLRKAMAAARKKGPTVVAGSLYTIGEALKTRTFAALT